MFLKFKVCSNCDCLDMLERYSDSRFLVAKYGRPCEHCKEELYRVTVKSEEVHNAC